MLGVCAAGLVVAGCSSDPQPTDPPAAADEPGEVAPDDDGRSADGAADGGEGDGSGGGYGLVDEVCATFDHDHFVDVHGIPATVVADDVTSLGGHTDYLYCELDAGTQTGPDGQTLSVAIFFHPSADVARQVFDGHAEGQASVEELVGPWTEAALIASPVTSGGRYTARLYLIDGPLDVWIEAQTLEAFPMAVWAEPLERIAHQVLASLRAG
ncbi:hypothetical protein [Nitriliruptor alkaliphilus]|uniref:hypothetical protein n=1 Tax=Nitriliruptor alkaliphilus TaxID=427918 RepID=UPI0006983D9F|nr:hypothetical protein [Nitriliruptor alkaliphilus]